MIGSMTRFFEEAFSEKELEVLKEILGTIRPIFKREARSDTKMFLIGMKALYYYYGVEPFLPADISVDTDINFDILLEWATYRKIIPQKIKQALESLGYNIDVELGRISIQKEEVVVDLTTVIEYSEDYIEDYIADLELDVGNRYFIIYTKLSRFNQYKDVDRLKNLFKNREIDFDKVLDFAPELERDLINKRKDSLLQKKE